MEKKPNKHFQVIMGGEILCPPLPPAEYVFNKIISCSNLDNSNELSGWMNMYFKYYCKFLGLK